MTETGCVALVIKGGGWNVVGFVLVCPRSALGLPWVGLTPPRAGGCLARAFIPRCERSCWDGPPAVRDGTNRTRFQLWSGTLLSGTGTALSRMVLPDLCSFCLRLCRPHTHLPGSLCSPSPPSQDREEPGGPRGAESGGTDHFFPLASVTCKADSDRSLAGSVGPCPGAPVLHLSFALLWIESRSCLSSFIQRPAGHLDAGLGGGGGHQNSSQASGFVLSMPQREDAYLAFSLLSH